MKITDVRAVVVGNPWKNWVFVIVETDEGITGLGEATGGLQTPAHDVSIQSTFMAAAPGCLRSAAIHCSH